MRPSLLEQRCIAHLLPECRMRRDQSLGSAGPMATKTGQYAKRILQVISHLGKTLNPAPSVVARAWALFIPFPASPRMLSAVSKPTVLMRYPNEATPDRTSLFQITGSHANWSSPVSQCAFRVQATGVATLRLHSKMARVEKGKAWR